MASNNIDGLRKLSLFYVERSNVVKNRKNDTKKSKVLQYFGMC